MPPPDDRKADALKPTRITPGLLGSAAVMLTGLAVLLASGGCQTAEQRKITVLLLEYQGPEAVATARRVAKELTDQGLKETFVVEGAEAASLCVGRYDSWKDPAADAMLRRIRTIRDLQGQYPFIGVMLVPVPEPAPENPWPLQKAKGYYTLNVASWEAPGRLTAAVAFARELRARGFEAYVYHGPRISSVSVGAFGPEILDNPALVGLTKDPDRPGPPPPKPKIVDPKVLNLMNNKFPRMRLEGEETPPEARLPTDLVSIPGRTPPNVRSVGIPKSLYRITLSLVDTRTGLAEGRRETSGVAQSKAEMLVVVAVLLKQMVDTLPEGRTVRVGLAGVAPTDAETARDGADAAAQEAVGKVLSRAVTKVVFINPDATQQMLDAAGLRAADVLRDPRTLRGFTGLDYVVTGTVTAFPVEGARPSAPP